MLQKRANTRDIAAAAGVSQATVSNVLSGKSRLPIADATRQRVMQAAEELRYRPNRLAAGIFRGKTSMVGVVLPDVGGSYYGDMLRGIQKACMEMDCVTMLSYTQVDAHSEEREVNRLLEHRVDGLLVGVSRFTLPKANRWIGDMRGEGIPCVMLDDRSYTPAMDIVASDDVDGATQIVNHLIELGHRRIALIIGTYEMTTYRDRWTGYEQSLSQAGIAVDPALIAQFGWEVEPEPFSDALSAFMALPDPPTAIFAVTDYHAHEAVQWLRERGMSVPGDMSVAGYAGTEVARGLDLTTIDQNPYTMGYTAANKLFERLTNIEAPPVETLLPTTLIVRHSTAPPKSGE